MPMQLPCLRRAAPRLALALSLLTLLPAIASAQYFGRNKVQWERFDWQILRTEHFDIYYYPEEEQAVREAARLAERWYDRLSAVFERPFHERKSIILYADPSDFQQTTVIGGLIGQGTGGVTESLRTRVVLPFTGNWEDSDHVLGHELVHVFQYDILQDPRLRAPGTQGGGGANVPLWFVEGLAEYLSIGRSSSLSAMWLRDAVARDQLPTIRQLARNPRLFPYRWGHALWAYIGGRFGDVATTRVFTRGTQVGLEAAVQEVLGLSVEELSTDWQAAIRRDYGPVVEGRQAPAALGTRIIPRDGEVRDETNVGPVLSPNGQDVVFFSTRGLFSFDLYLADARTGEIRQRLVSQDADPHFDALQFIDSAGAWSPDGRRFAFVVAARGDNELAIVDVATRDIERRIPFRDVGALWNPTWSPDGRSIVVSGSAGGITDLYQLDLESGTARKLTDDVFSDLQPDWSPDGRTVAFVSDRAAGESLADLTRETSMGVWLLDVASGQTRQVAADFEGNQYNPRFGPGGRDLFFLSDRDGVSDVYRLDTGSGQIFRVTRVATGVTGITELSPALTVAPSSGRVMFSVFFDTGYQIHSLEPAEARGEPVETTGAPRARAALLPPAGPGQVPGRVDQYLASARGLERQPTETGEYRPRLQLDFVGPSVGVGVSSLGYTYGGDITAFFSDMLGQREVGFTVQGASGSNLDQLGGQGYYLNQERRWQWGVAGGYVPYTTAFTRAFGADVDLGGGEVAPGVIYQQVRETVTLSGASFITRYPFSTTRRFDFNVGVTRLDYENELLELVTVNDRVIDENERDLPSPAGLQLYQAAAILVGDNSSFGFTSPVRGRRYHLELESSFGDLQFQSLIADYRRYFFARPVTFAVRGLHVGRYGSDAESPRLSQLYVGRPTLVRGYEIDDIDLSECTPVPDRPNACPEFDRLVGSRYGVANLELRLPVFGTRGYGLVNLPYLPLEMSAFVDAGVAWTEDESPDLRFEERSADRVPVVSAGLSARLLLGGFAVLEFYYAQPFQRPDAGMVAGFVISPGW